MRSRQESPRSVPLTHAGRPPRSSTQRRISSWLTVKFPEPPPRFPEREPPFVLVVGIKNHLFLRMQKFFARLASGCKHKAIEFTQENSERHFCAHALRKKRA